MSDLRTAMTLFFASMIVILEFAGRRLESTREQRLLDAIQREYEQFFQTERSIFWVTTETAGLIPDIHEPTYFEA